MPVSKNIRLTSASAGETRDLGRRIARGMRPGDVVLLHGDLGAGKTTLTQGIAEGLGVTTTVQSPTFVLVHEHAGRAADGKPLALHHLDLYRLAGEDEVEAIGYDEYLSPEDGVSVVEWPERAGTLLPDACLLVEIRAGTGDERSITMTAIGPEDAARRWLAPLSECTDSRRDGASGEPSHAP